MAKYEPETGSCQIGSVDRESLDQNQNQQEKVMVIPETVKDNITGKLKLPNRGR